MPPKRAIFSWSHHDFSIIREHFGFRGPIQALIGMTWGLTLFCFQHGVAIKHRICRRHRRIFDSLSTSCQEEANTTDQIVDTDNFANLHLPLASDELKA
jgi:hypothetical protein